MEGINFNLTHEVNKNGLLILSINDIPHFVTLKNNIVGFQTYYEDEGMVVEVYLKTSRSTIILGYDSEGKWKAVINKLIEILCEK